MKTALDMGSVGSSCSASTQVHHFLRPGNLELLSVLPKTTDKKWRRPICQGKLAYVVHVLCELRAKYKAKPAEFVSVSYAMLVKVIGTRYAADALRVLQDAGVIESDRRHVVGLKARGYRFASAYQTPVEAFPPIEKAAIKSLRVQQERVARVVATNQNYCFLFDSLRSLSFSEGAESFLSSPEIEEAARLPLRLSYENLKRGRLEFSTDLKTQRVFHNVANMAKPLRRFLRLDGEECVEIDLANAQPLLLLSLYGAGATSQNERLKYSSFVSAGRFYERLNALAGSPYTTALGDGRDRLKRAFQQQILSGKNHYTGRLKTAFFSEFPILAKAITSEKTENHGALSRRLQRVEANLVIDRVVSRIRLEQPTTKVVTIHDAILCAKSRAETVARIFSEETESLLGVRPTLNTTPTP
jgi:hypothetical protein